jgi:hypothetical protein
MTVHLSMLVACSHGQACYLALSLSTQSLFLRTYVLLVVCFVVHNLFPARDGLIVGKTSVYQRCSLVGSCSTQV